MSRAHAESVIKNIIREIVQECAVRGHAVSDTLVAFMVKAVVLDPRNGFNVDRTLTKQDIQKLEEMCLDKLMEKCSPSLDTIKMQVYFDMNYTSRREFLEEIQQVVESRLSPVSRDITDSRVKTREELDSLYHRIVTYILLRSGMGSPAHVHAAQEAAAALQSVFPPTELGAFMVLLKKEKEQQLRELTMIVTGIRLFNKACKGGAQETELHELDVELLNILSNITHNLQRFLASQAETFSEAYLDDVLRTSDVKTDEQRMTESSDERIVPAEMKTQEWLLPETTDSFNDLLLQYNGVCGHTLMNRDGLLLPGNPHIGVLKHKEKHYVFSSKEAALKFASCPDDFITEVAEKAKLCPELIQLLKLHQQFSRVTPYTELEPGESLLVKSITKCEISTQTDIHPVERNIIPSYEWNEWELRRKAIKLADLRTKVTHSAQTDLSHMRRENVTQTWPPKDVGCQSKRDGATNVPKPQVYLAGLRGQRDARVVKTDLTRSVED